MSSARLNQDDARLLAAADTVRGALEGSRSDRLLRLFDYLLTKTMAGETPSEQTIASEAFADENFLDTGQDANVRVYVHRLRKALDSAFAEISGPRLYIPVGEYRICLSDEDDGEVTGQPQPESGVTVRGGPRYRRMAAMVAAALVCVIAGWWWLNRSTPPLAQTQVWQAFDQSERPLVVVVGDYYLFAQLDSPGGTPDAGPQLVWDKEVPTREDLTILQMLDPAHAHSIVDYNQQFVSGGSIQALSAVRADINQLPSLRRRSTRLVAASQLTPEMLKASDIIYVGQFNGMPPLLKDPLGQASGFRIESGFEGLTDAASSKRYQSDGMVLTDERIARRDYAYLASVPGPADNRLLVIAGIGDAGLKEAAQLVGNLDQLERLAANPAKLRSGFEALYRVRTIEHVNVGATPVLDRPLKSGEIWDSSGNVAPYRPFDTKADSPAPE